jgi:hypothetical protein
VVVEVLARREETMAEQEQVAGNPGARTSSPASASLPGIPMDMPPLAASPMATPAIGTLRTVLEPPPSAPPPDRGPPPDVAPPEPARVSAPVTAPAPASPLLPWAQAFTQIFTRVVVLALVFFVVVWPYLPFDAGAKWIVAGVVLLGILAFSVAAFVMVRAQSVAFFKSLRDAIAVIAIIGGAVVAALVFAPGARNEVFKLFAVVYFSLLPAALYLQFMAVRGPTLWEEFTDNLYRLRFDDASSLPRPPPNCRYYPAWLSARAARAAPPAKTLYQKKFEGVFGAIPCGDDSRPPLHTEKLAPVIMATILFSVAWVIVVMPAPLFELTLFGHAPQGAESPAIPLGTLRFGFLGAYFYAVQMLVRRYFQNDLKASAYHNATMRIVTVALLVWTVDLGLGNQPYEVRWPLAFVIGVFPDVGWKALQTAVKIPLRALVPSLRQPYPLSDLDGLNVWYEARLLEEGIEDMQNLATCNLVDVMLNTRIPVERLVDWIDQSILYLHLGKPVEGEGNPRDQLRRYGIRTATDLEDAFRPARDVADEAERIVKLERLLTTGPDEPSVLRTLLATLGSEPNLSYVRAWRSAEDAPRAIDLGGRAPAG